MLPFVRTETPVVSYQRNRSANQQAELNDLRIGEARRAERVAQAVDTALGRANDEAGDRTGPTTPATVPVPAGMDQVAAANLQSDPGAEQFRTQQQPSMSSGERLRAVRGAASQHLLRTPGARAEGARMMALDAQAEEQVMRQTFEMAKTDPQQARLFAQQSGVKLSPQMDAALQDRTTVTQWSRAMEAAAKTYPDPNQAGKRFQFAKQYFLGLKSGDVGNAVASAPAPADTPRYAPQLTTGVDSNGQAHQMIWDPNTRKLTGTGYLATQQPAPQYLYGQDGTVFTNRNGTAVPVMTEGGEQFKGTGLRGVGAGRTTSIAPNPQTVRMRAMAWAERQKDPAGMPLYQTPQQREAAIKAYEAYVGGDFASAGQILAQANPQTAKQPGMLERIFGSLQQDGQQSAAGPAGGEAQINLGGALQNGGIPPTYADGQVSGTFTGEFEGGLPVYVTAEGRRFVAE